MREGGVVQGGVTSGGGHRAVAPGKTTLASRLGRASAATAAPAAGAPDRRPPRDDVSVASRRVVDLASRLTTAQPEARAVGSLVDAMWLLVTVVESRDRIADTDLVHVACAVDAVGDLGAMIDDEDGERLADVLGVLLARLGAKGAALPQLTSGSHPAPPPSSALVQLKLVRDAVDDRSTQLSQVIRGGSRDLATKMLASDTELLVALIRSAGALVAEVRADPMDLNAAIPIVRSIGEQIESWFTYARANQISQGDAGLDEVFLAEDALFVTAGLNPPNRRRRFYENLTASDWRGEPRDGKPVIGKTSGDVIDKIEAWMTDEPLRTLLGISDLATILQEPARAREPSTLERVIAAAVRNFLALLPGYLGGLITGAASALAAGTPRPPESPDLTELRIYSRSPAPPPADSHPELAKLTRVADHLPAVMAPIIGAIGPHASVAAAGQRGAVLTGDRRDDRPLTTAFIIQLHTGVAITMRALVNEASPLREALELYPPDQLESYYQRLTARSPSEAASTLRSGLVMQWANVLAAATNGLDADGTNAHGGTIEQGTDLPGTLQIAMTVRPGVDGSLAIDVQHLRVNGLSRSALYELRKADQPVEHLAMHRVMHVEAPDQDGFVVPIGVVDISPTGTFDLDRADVLALARLAAGEQPWPTGDSLETASLVSRLANPRFVAQRGAQKLIASTRKTTADIA